MKGGGLFSLRNKTIGTTSNSSKRIKISRACDECRKRKVKCDGVQPACGRCQKSNVDCIFAKIPPKKGPPKQYMENLENRLQRVEKALSGIPIPSNQKRSMIRLRTDSGGKYSINEMGQAIYIDNKEEQDLNLIEVTSEIQTLIDVYFEYVHKYVPMIHKPTFLKQLNNGDISKLLIFSMCAISSKWSHLSTEQPAGYDWYKKSVHLLDNYLDQPRLTTVQALILLIKYQEYYQRAGYFYRTQFLVSTASKMSFDLGLDQLNNEEVTEDQDIEDELLYEVKKRTFWIIFIYDLLSNMEQGQLTNFKEYNTGFPLVTVEEGPALEEFIIHQNINIQLCKTLYEIYLFSNKLKKRQEVQSNNRSSQQIIEEQSTLFSLNTHLENILYELPPSLNYHPPQLNDPFIAFFHMTYHFSIILLHRQFLQQPKTEFIEYSHRKLCQSSASTITDIVQSLFKHYSFSTFHYPTRGIQHTIHCLSMATTIHKYEMLTSLDANKQYHVSMQLLKRLSTQSPCIQLHPALNDFNYYLYQPDMLDETTTITTTTTAMTATATTTTTTTNHAIPLLQEDTFQPVWPTQQQIPTDQQWYYPPYEAILPDQHNNTILPAQQNRIRRHTVSTYPLMDTVMMDTQHDDPINGMSQLYLHDDHHPMYE